MGLLQQEKLNLCVVLGKNLFFPTMRIWGQGPKFKFLYVLLLFVVLNLGVDLAPKCH
jgi:hypothetical protein